MHVTIPGVEKVPLESDTGLAGWCEGAVRGFRPGASPTAVKYCPGSLSAMKCRNGAWIGDQTHSKQLHDSR